MNETLHYLKPLSYPFAGLGEWWFCLHGDAKEVTGCYDELPALAQELGPLPVEVRVRGLARPCVCVSVCV